MFRTSFLIGLFAGWLYAAIRPRYGAGPKTALCAGLFVWFLGYLLTSVTPFLLNDRNLWVVVAAHSLGNAALLIGWYLSP